MSIGSSNEKLTPLVRTDHQPERLSGRRQGETDGPDRLPGGAEARTLEQAWRQAIDNRYAEAENLLKQLAP
jgi:hypothetical protein